MADTYPTSPSVGDTRTRPDGTVEMCTDATAPYTWEIIGGSLGPGITKQVFTSSGTYTPSAGMRYCIVEVVGGGGGGGGAGGSSPSFARGGAGGGSGGYSKSALTAAEIGSSQTVTVGSGGSGGVGAAAGSSGGASSLGTLVTANGGTYGGTSFGDGGAGATAGTGDIASGGSGGSAGVSGGSGVLAVGGQGGDSVFGGGGKGITTSSGPETGIAAVGYGGGGGAAAGFNTSTAPTGGDGADGIVIITEFLGESYGGGTETGYPADGRLTLESGVPVSTSNQTAKTTIYYTPYVGNRISLYNGTHWQVHQFSELSLSISGYTANTNYDVWVYSNSGVATLDTTAWTDNTTRATALDRQDGVLVKSGDATRRYVGTFRTTGTTGQTQLDFGGSASGGDNANFYFWNAYNRVQVSGKIQDTTASWSYSTATWRSANNQNGMRFKFIVGLDGHVARASYAMYSSCTGAANRFAGVGLDTTSANSGLCEGGGNAGGVVAMGLYVGDPGVGFHYLQAVEIAQAVGTTTWYPDLLGGTDCGLTYMWEY